MVYVEWDNFGVSIIDAVLDNVRKKTKSVLLI